MSEKLSKSLKILTFSTLYPNSVQTRHGIFVEERLRHLLASGEVSATVIAPVPWFPLRSERFGEYARLAHVPAVEERIGTLAFYPRYPVIPKIGMVVAPFLLAAAVFRRVRGMLKAKGPDVTLDAHYLYPDGVAACMIGKLLKVPVIMTARGNDVTLLPNYRLPRAMILWAVRHAAKVITVSESLRTQLIQLGAQPEKIITLRNGVDLEKFKPANQPPNRVVAAEGLKVLSVGHLIERKRHDVSISAVAKTPGAQLTVIGEGPLRSALMAQVDKLGIADRVHFTGNLSQVELAQRYADADVLLLPSEREGMPNVVLESLASGTPVIASDAEGVEELITCPEAGRVVRQRDGTAFSAAIEDLIANYPDRSKTRMHAQSLGWEPTISGLLGVLREIHSTRVA